MASTFDTAMAAATAKFLLEFGETIAIWPNGVAGSTRNISAIVRREDRRSELSEQSGNMYNSMTIVISAANDTEGRIAPQERHKSNSPVPDNFVIDGANWTLNRILERNVGGMHTLEVWDTGQD